MPSSNTNLSLSLATDRRCVVMRSLIRGSCGERRRRTERTAEEARPRQAEAPGYVNRLGDADARPGDHGLRKVGRHQAEGWPVEAQAVVLAGDAQGLAQP